MRIVLVAGLAATMGVAGPVLAQNDWEDRPMTAQERERVVRAVVAAGCEAPTRIERDDDGYEVDNVRCRDGVYDLDLDRRFRIIDRDREDDRPRR